MRGPDITCEAGRPSLVRSSSFKPIAHLNRFTDFKATVEVATDNTTVDSDTVHWRYSDCEGIWIPPIHVPLDWTEILNAPEANSCVPTCGTSALDCKSRRVNNRFESYSSVSIFAPRCPKRRNVRDGLLYG